MFVESKKQQGVKNPMKELFTKKKMRYQPILLSFSVVVLLVHLILAISGRTSLSKDSSGYVYYNYLNFTVVYLFIADFCYRFYVSEDKILFLKKHWIDLILCIPFYSPQWMVVTTTIRSLKVILEHVLTEVHSAFKSMLILGASLVTFSSISILQFEVIPESNIKTIQDALWWSICTITTVGYGDKYPMTGGGKFVAIILMISGIGLFGTLIGYFSTVFIDKEKKDNDKIDTIEELSKQIEDLKKQIINK